MEMAEKVEKDPSDKLSKVHNDIMHAYETEFGKDDIWDEIVFCLGTEKSRFKRLDRVRRKLLGNTSKERNDNIYTM